MHVHYLWLVAVASVIGFLGNELVAPLPNQGGPGDEI
jgi:hypothetical protein